MNAGVRGSEGSAICRDRGRRKVVERRPESISRAFAARTLLFSQDRVFTPKTGLQTLFRCQTDRIADRRRVRWHPPEPRSLAILCLIVVLAGCASYAPIDNQPADGVSLEDSYSLKSHLRAYGSSDQRLMLALSGGGTRAAALSYGVLEALRDTRVETSSGEASLLDSVDSISSVSGGSFTSAYYGLYGDKIFEDFEDDFLRKDVQGDLLNKLVNPFNWFRLGKRTDWAVDYYQEHVFKGATFADLLAADGPMIIINASDLSAGIAFWFLQEYFDLLCSDILDFPVSRAVAASSAVPGLFSPVTLKNYGDCSERNSSIIETTRSETERHPELEMALRGLRSYSDKERKPYVHLVDGGITDNLGLRVITDVSKLVGGVGNYYRRFDRKPPRRIVVISVDAANEPDYPMNRSSRVPTISEVMGAMSGVQLHRYNADTLAIIQEELRTWGRELSTPDNPVDVYFIALNFNQVGDPARREVLNAIPTSFSLTDEQVDVLIETGGDLLRGHPVFQKLITDLQRRSAEGYLDPDQT